MILWLAGAALAVDFDVRDRTDGDPVRDAIVVSNGSEARTDDTGRASLVLPEGTWTVTVTSASYAPLTLSVTAPHERPVRVWMTAVG